jgi:AraC-like DNA-binding protein
MSAIDKTIWLIETHFGLPLSLDEMASHAGISRTYLSRIFPLATGYSISGYTRARRLSEAAKVLADGAPDILAVALDAGYGSHEAFTRALLCDYMTAMEVTADADLPREFTALTVPPQRFARFRHGGHISTIRSTIGAIYESWLPGSGETQNQELSFLEYYGPDFNGQTGLGTIEIWIGLED